MKRLLAALVLVILSGCASAPEFRSAARDLVPHVVALQGEGGRVFCSGVAISETRILTNKHCTETGDLQSVRTHDQQLLGVTVAYTSSGLDFAVLEVASPVLKPARLGKSAEVEQGDFAIAIGHPYGLEWTVTFGHINKPRVKAEFAPGEYLGHNAIINPGNSGGPLFNAAGEVVGINTWIIRGAGLGYALSIDQVLAELAAK